RLQALCMAPWNRFLSSRNRFWPLKTRKQVFRNEHDYGCGSRVHFLFSPLIIEPVNILWVMLRESKRHEGAYGANDPAYDNSGLSDVVDDWGVFRLTSRFTGGYIRNIKERNPQVYMIKRKTVTGWGIERVVLGEVRPIVVQD
ncbi:hypothetical protein PIB30_102266, partial [Stylosanthes scabra]|nr:hypothetical protein [Stylosanthes scabra]